MKPRLFVASSIESLGVAYAVQENLDHEMEVTVWSQGAFDLSRTPLQSLVKMAKNVDGAAFVFSPNDQLIVRGETKPAVRDNVIFELGLFVGVLGSDKCFVVKPRSFPTLNFPSDLMGMTPTDYADDRADKNTVAALGLACNQIRRALKEDTTPLPPPTRHRTHDSMSFIVVETLEQIVTGKLFRLYFNPPRYKHIKFEADGKISEGKNDNEATWRIVNDQLELVQTDGKVHNTFTYDRSQARFFAEGVSQKGLGGQYIAPAV